MSNKNKPANKPKMTTAATKEVLQDNLKVSDGLADASKGEPTIAPTLPQEHQVVSYSLLYFCSVTQDLILKGYRFDFGSVDRSPLNYFNSGIFQCTMVLPEKEAKVKPRAFTMTIPQLG